MVVVKVEIKSSYVSTTIIGSANMDSQDRKGTQNLVWRDVAGAMSVRNSLDMDIRREAVLEKR